MKMLITGSSGFLGAHTVAHAKRRGWHVSGVDNRLPYQDDVLPHCFRLEDFAQIGVHQLEGIDTLIHFAAFPSLSGFSDHTATNYHNNVSAFIGL